MFHNEIKDLLNSRYPALWICTSEEKEVVVELRNIFAELSEYEDIYVWSLTDGINKLVLRNNELKYEAVSEIQGLSALQSKLKESNDSELILSRAWILRDYHLVLNNPQAIRMIRDLKENPINKYTPIVIISPSSDIPMELKSMFKLINYNTPNKEDIKELIKEWTILYNQEAEDEEINYLSNILNGFTRSEILNMFNLSFCKHGSFDLELINQKKIETIKESGVLDYKFPDESLDNMGGNDNFKEWLEVVSMCMTPEAKEYGIPTPKGYLSIGVPGTSKTYSAEALASSLQIPLIKLNMAKINSRFAGETERNMYKALNIVKSSSPCVLLIDEVEKSLGGISSSNNSDSGAIARAFGLVLEFLNDNNGVFVIMTSNDVTQLPPELTRAGRLDAIWYFGLPSIEERREIFKIHFNKKDKNIENNIIELAVEETNKYTGAEIELIVNNSLKRAFLEYMKTGQDAGITENIIRRAIKDVVPISTFSEKKISELENWAKGRALFASKKDSSLLVKKPIMSLE